MTDVIEEVVTRHTSLFGKTALVTGDSRCNHPPSPYRTSGNFSYMHGCDGNTWQNDGDDVALLTRPNCGTS
jgi:hypothetical protein